MQYTEDNSVDNSNAWRQFEREKICFKPTCPDVPECISGQALIYLQQKDPNTPAGGILVKMRVVY